MFSKEHTLLLLQLTSFMQLSLQHNYLCYWLRSGTSWHFSSGIGAEGPHIHRERAVQRSLVLLLCPFATFHQVAALVGGLVWLFYVLNSRYSPGSISDGLFFTSQTRSKLNGDTEVGRCLWNSVNSFLAFKTQWNRSGKINFYNVTVIRTNLTKDVQENQVF